MTFGGFGCILFLSFQITSVQAGILGGNVSARGEVGMRKQSPLNRILAVFLILTCAFLPACEQVVAGPAATVTPIPTCVSPTIPNLYSEHDVEDVVTFYQTYISNFGNQGVLENLRKEAFLRFVELVRYESATRILTDNESHVVQVTVTLLDPALIQYAILNQMLNNILSNGLYVAPDDPLYGVDAFRERIKSAMKDIAKREELLFLVMVTSPVYDSQGTGGNGFTVAIPFENMELINASDVFVPSTHDDHNLGAPLGTGNNIVTGLVSYPLGMGAPGQCAYLLDAWNTTLTLQVAGIRLGNAEPIGTIMWTVPFNALIHDDFIRHGDPFYHNYQYGDLPLDRIVRTPAPPTPDLALNFIADPKLLDEYWQRVSQYIWQVIVTLSHH